METTKHDFKTIGLIGRYGDPTVSTLLNDLSVFLKNRKLTVLLDESTASIIPDNNLVIADRRTIGEKCDLVIVLGGDGTLLNAVRSLSDYKVPLLGINRGRLGFLADIQPREMEKHLNEILDGHYISNKRFLLHTHIEREGEQISDSNAFNDVVVHKWDVARMIEVKIFIDGKYVNTMRSDGLIVSTPTGSTAYALSGGGPIINPSLNAIVLVPICPHTMSNRPIVIDGDSQIRIKVKNASQSQAQVTCDGQINLGLVSGDYVLIHKKDNPVELIHPTNHDYYEILRAKLHWGERLQ
ncbi:MAG: NAD(+) kinase [Gammaproteobacteria bacterium]|nr:NAD(+) kinase [Gammaproteobacteria bacterium]